MKIDGLELSYAYGDRSWSKANRFTREVHGWGLATGRPIIKRDDPAIVAERKKKKRGRVNRKGWEELNKFSTQRSAPEIIVDFSFFCFFFVILNVRR
jgi:hypothetical protein